MLLRLFLFGLFSVSFLGGCENNEAADPNDPEDIYKKSCLGCHGADLKGSSGPAVTNMAKKYSEAELYTLIMDGKGMMPGNLLSEEEAKKITNWLMTK